ncbi:ABC transporter substrate-binding protein [Kineococcus glutinatus]|uniref:peptide ABC transporter substrate-binding protein n=1 Tax=Kineococcus glutinatus TaxID=1070872 RepID=UPI0031E58E58
MRGVRGLAIVAAASLALAGCSGNSDDQGADDESTSSGGVVLANGTEPQNPLLPANTNEVGGGRIVDSIYAGLVYYEADGTASNDLAESIETTDSQNYTITIKPGQTFSDGTPVTAQSFVDAWNFGAAAVNAQLSSSFFEPIAGYDEVSAEGSTLTEMSGLAVVDETTFTVALKQPESDFPLRLGYSAFYPLPESAYADIEAFGENPVGNGPYELAGEGAWQHDTRIDLVPNDSYTGPRKAQNDGLSFVFYADDDAAYTDLQAGALDVIDQIPDSALATYEADLGDRAVNEPAAIIQTFTIPMDLPHFTGEEGRLRRAAISHAIDRETITEAIFQGTRTPATDFTSPVLEGYSEDVPGNEVQAYDPDRAKQLWAEADAIAPWSGTFQIAYNSDGPHQGWVDAVSNNIRQTLGIEAEGKPYPTFGQLRAEITGGTVAAAFRSGWQGDYPSLQNFLGPNYQTGGSSNDGDYSNPAFDALITQAAGTADREQANALLLQAQTILFQDLPNISLWYQNVSAGSAETVSNVQYGWNSQPLYYAITKE